jgi:hypothetical protein
MTTESTESLLTSGQETTAAAGEQTAADTTGTPAAGAQTATDDAAAQAATAAAAKGEGAEGAAKDAGAKEGDKPTGAPETYETFTVPEGFALDEQLLGEFTPVLKELNLPQDAAQKLIDFAPKLVEKTIADTTAAVLDRFGLKDAPAWVESVRTDPELGGEKLAENLGVAQKFMTAFATPGLRAILNQTGLGNHPELIRACFRAGKAISEDGFVPGGKATTVQNPAARLYDASNMNP